MQAKKFPVLLLLVGSNPLPNYLVACALKPERLVLVYTSATKWAYDRLVEALDQCAGLGEVEIEPAFVSEPNSAVTMKRALRPWLDDAKKPSQGFPQIWLNYTGGTKVMAAQARLIFERAGGESRHASYLDEGGAEQEPTLRFDDGSSQPLSNYPRLTLNLQAILMLHGIHARPRSSKPPAPSEQDALAILEGVLHRPELAAELHKERRRFEDAIAAKLPWKDLPPFVGEKHGLELSLSAFPNTSLSRAAFEQWYSFIGGEWLEAWTGSQLRALVPEADITVGINAFRGEAKAQFEVDAALVRGHRSYFISCTTAQEKHLCKTKAFEIAVRARHLGGDLARSALVCLAGDKHTRALQHDIHELWGASNSTRVFGFSDVCRWSNIDGPPNLSDLQHWLAS